MAIFLTVLKVIGWILLAVFAIILFVLCVRIRIGVEYSDDNTNVMLEWLFLKIPLYPMKKAEQGSEKSPENKKDKSKKKKKKDEPDTSRKEEAPPEEESPQGSEAVTAETADAKTEPAPGERTEERTAEDDPGRTDAEFSDEAEVNGEPADGAAEQPASADGGEKAPEKPAKKKESLLHMIYRTHGIDGIMQILRRVFSYLGSYFGDLMKSLVIEELFLDIGCTRSDAAATAIYYGEVCSALYPMLGALASKCKIKKYDVNVYPDYLARFSKASFYVKFHLYPIYVCAITVVLVCRLIFKVLLGFLVKLFLPRKEKKAEKQNINTEKRDDSNEGSVSSRNSVNNDREGTSAC